MIFETAPGKARTIVGRGLVIVGLTLIFLVIMYFARNILKVGDLLAMILGTFALAVGATIASLGWLLGGSSLITRRVGCIAFIVFSVPTAVIFAFLVLSLFRTVEPRASSNSALQPTPTRAT